MGRVEEKPRRRPFGTPLFILSYLRDVLIPFILAFSLWYWLETTFMFTEPGTYLHFISFAVIVLPADLLITIASDRTRRWLRGIVSPAGTSFRETRGRRLARYLISGIVVPLLVAIAANLVPVSGQDTVATILLKWLFGWRGYPFVTKLADTVISASTAQTKRDGILALGAMASDPSLAELLRVLEGDRKSLREARVYDAMAEALAAFGTRGKGALLQAFGKFDKRRQGAREEWTPDLHERYLQSAFEAIRRDTKDEVVESQEKRVLLLQLDEIETKVKGDLKRLEAIGAPTESDALALDVILDAFRQMKDFKEDKDVYLVAKRLADNPVYGDRTRVKAILLFAKLGGPADFSELERYLDNKSESLRAAAFRGIRELHCKTASALQKSELCKNGRPF